MLRSARGAQPGGASRELGTLTSWPMNVTSPLGDRASAAWRRVAAPNAACSRASSSASGSSSSAASSPRASPGMAASV
jgi:hypothetical protein